MKHIINHILAITWIGTLVAPPLAVYLFVFVKNKWPQTIKMVIGSSTAALLTIICFIIFNISFTIPALNALTVVVLYCLYCILLASCWLIRFRLLKIIMVFIMSVPVLISYLLATIGAFAFMFILADFAATPSEKRIIKPGLKCQINGWGGWGVGVDRGYTVQLFESSKYLPFMERKVVKIDVNQSNPEYGDQKNATCEDALQKHMGKPTTHIVNKVNKNLY